MDQLLLDDESVRSSGYLKAKYCGTVFDNVNSKQSVVYVRFYAEKQAIKDSLFSATFTAMRNKENDKEACREVRSSFKCIIEIYHDYNLDMVFLVNICNIWNLLFRRNMTVKTQHVSIRACFAMGLETVSSVGMRILQCVASQMEQWRLTSLPQQFL